MSYDFDDLARKELEDTKRYAIEILKDSKIIWMCCICGREFDSQRDWIIHMYECRKRNKKKK